jgi:hypothetical protein
MDDTNNGSHIIESPSFNMEQLINGNETPLILAARCGRSDVVEVLLRAGANVNNVMPRSGETALLTASWYGHLHVISILLAHGANVNIQDNDGHTAIMQATLQSRLDIVNLLLSNGADPNIFNSNGRTPGMEARRIHAYDIAEVLDGRTTPIQDVLLPKAYTGPQNEVCSICIDVLEADCASTGLACGHVFHHGCIKTWSTLKRSCPYCRKAF